MGLVEKEGAFLTVCLKDIVKSEDIAKSENIAGSEDIARLEVIAGSEDIAGSGDTVRPGDKDKMNIRKLVLPVLAWIICIVGAYKLYTLVRADQAAQEERYAVLQMQAAASEETEIEKLEKQTDIYDKLYSQIDVNDFICWGDSAMAGNGSRSLPTVLKKVIEDNLFSSLKKSFSRVLDTDEYTTPSVKVNNMGVTGEGMRQILVRAGVNIMETGESITIPWGTEPVTVRFMDDEAWDRLDPKKNPDEQLKFARQKTVDFGKVYIDGIRGSLVTTDTWFDSGHPQYAFVRKEEGDSTYVRSGTEIEIETATRYLGDTPVFFFENDSGRSIDGFVTDIEKLVNRYAIDEVPETDPSEETSQEEEKENSPDDENAEESDASAEPAYDRPFVVICTALEDSDLDKALRRRFGTRYIRNDDYASEMTERNYKKLAQEVFDNLDSQGCFTEVQAQILMAVQEAEGL